MLCPRKFSIYRCFAEKTVFEVLEKPAFPGKFLLTNIKNHLISNKVSYHNINLSIFILNLIMPLLLFHDGGRYTETSPLILLCKSMDWFLYDNGLLHERDRWLNVRLWNELLWNWLLLQLLNLQIWRLFRARSSLSFRKLQSVHFILFIYLLFI